MTSAVVYSLGKLLGNLGRIPNHSRAKFSAWYSNDRSLEKPDNEFCLFQCDGPPVSLRITQQPNSFSRSGWPLSHGGERPTTAVGKPEETGKRPESWQSHRIHGVDLEKQIGA